jgi:peptide-methionine (S)-S-oxide reductase
VFSELNGVLSVVPGYAGGHAANPSYESVCTGTTGHAEAVEITFDPNGVSYRELLLIFFSTHDPTTPNRQGHDVGPQYRSAIFYHDEAQRSEAEAVVHAMEADRVWRRKVVTEIVPYSVFYPAEEYHHRYYQRHPERGYCQSVIAPKMAEFRKKFASRLRPRPAE